MGQKKSGQRDSNPRLPAWEAGTLPLSYARSGPAESTSASGPYFTACRFCFQLCKRGLKPGFKLDIHYQARSNKPIKIKEGVMKRLFCVIPLVFLLCFTFGCQKAEEVAEEPAIDVEADMEAIKSLTGECLRTWNEGDYEGYMALIDEEAMFLPPNAPTFGGMETIRSIYKTSFDSLNFNVAITTEEIHVCGDLAFSRDGWKGSMNPKDGSEPIVFDNKTLSIYKRQADGSWKYWRIIYSSNNPPPTE